LTVTTNVQEKAAIKPEMTMVHKRYNKEGVESPNSGPGPVPCQKKAVG